MNLLAIDTSTTLASVALLAGDRLLVGPETPQDAGGRHGRGLLPTIAGLLEAANLHPGDLDLIGVGLGPGSYTGLRVGITAAKSLAFARDTPLVALDTLEAIAQGALVDAGRVAVVVDAQRSSLFVADFARHSPGAPLVQVGPTRVEPAADWAAGLKGGTYVLGPGLERLDVGWPDSVRLGTPAQGHPTATALITLAEAAFRLGQFVDPRWLEPVYLRRSAAEDQWDRR